MEPIEVVVQGWDISLNHGAIVQLRGGELDYWWYYTDKAGHAARSREHGARLPPNDKDDRHTKGMKRLSWIDGWIQDKVSNTLHVVGLEDYALRAEQGAHQLGEAGCVARMALWKRGVLWRLHDPVTVKMFACHDGTADKALVENAVAERWGWTFDHFNGNGPVPKGKPSRQTSEDLCDAFILAQMAWAEWRVRNGFLAMSDLHPKEIQVFNRITKTNPTSLLSREWLCGAADERESL
jgi:hypothetical protein